MDHDLDLRHRKIQEPVSLDHLETLVHQCGGVDGDLRAHLPRRVVQGLLLRHPGHIVQRRLSEGPARCRKDHPFHVSVRRLFQGLPHRSQLAVQRHQPYALSGRHLRHDVTRNNEGLLVGDGHILARLHRRERGPQSRPGHQSVHDQIDLRVGGQLDQPFWPIQHLDSKRRQAGPCLPGILGHADPSRSELRRLFAQEIHVASRTEPDHLEAVRKRIEHGQCVRADGARGPQ